MPHRTSMGIGKDSQSSVEKTGSPREGAEANHVEILPVESSVDEKALLKRIDWHVLPWLSLLYLLSFLDRTNIGNARLYNMEADLHITDTQYLIALTTFFFPYSVFEMPSNVLLKRLRPSRWLAFLMAVWGLIMTLHGIVRNYGGLITLRSLLGLFEAGLYPGVAFYLSCWYKRSELGLRVAVFFSAATVSGAFGGLLAAAIANMDGVGGRPAWAWIFILEGIVTFLAGIASFWIVQDFPDTAKFLTDEERAFVVRRMQADQQFSAAGEKFKKKYVWQSLTDKKTWIGMAMFMGFLGPLYAFSLFTPTIINQLGFTANAANLLSVPVYAWACLVTCFIGFLAGRVGQRGYINLIFFTIGGIGYIILLVSRNAALSYFAVFIAASGVYPTIPNSASWVAANTEGSYKRSAVLGMVLGWGNLNGAVTSNVYRAKDRPWYPLGHGIVLAYIAIGWLSSLAMRIVLKAENDKRDRGEGVEPIRMDNGNGIQEKEQESIYESVEAARQDKGDQWSGFRYVL